MLRKLIGLPAFGLVFFTALSVFPQADKETKGETPSRPTSCEVQRIVLDQAFLDFQKLEDDSALIIIIRLGANEKKRSLALSRMRDIEKFIQFRKVTDRYVLAEGSRTNNLGSAEIYIGGILTGGFYFAANSKSCETD